MRINDNYTQINVAAQEGDPYSVLNFYRKMQAFRQEHSDSLIFGSFQIHDATNEETFIFTKHSKDEDLAVVLNMSGKKQKLDLPYRGGDRKLLLTAAAEGIKEEILQPYEGRIYRIEGGERIREDKEVDTLHSVAGPDFA